MAALEEEGRSGWAGWLSFGAIMMLIVGTFQTIMGLTALFKDEYFYVPASKLVVNVNYSAWGWAHLLLGLLLILAGLSLFKSNLYGRIVGVIVAAASAIINVGFLSAYPVWSLLIITVDIVVIFAITVHGHDMA